jgi:phosphoadenosine phosphosulfate reductase
MMYPVPVVKKEEKYGSAATDKDEERRCRSAFPIPGLVPSPPESPVPGLRSSSTLSSSSLSSFDYDDVPNVSEEWETSSLSRFTLLRQNKGFKWICGAVVKLIIMSLLLRLHQRQQNHNDIKNKGSTDNNKLLKKLIDLSLPTTQQELSEVNDKLAGLDPRIILQWAHHHLHDSPELDSHPLVQATSFGPTGLVILDLLSQHDLLDNIPVITMDTLHLFKESYAFYDTVKSHYKTSLHLTITKPLDMIEEPITTRADFNHAYSSTLWKTDPKLYTLVTKLDPMQQKLEEWKTVMWITGRRRSQGGERVKLEVLEFEQYPQGIDTGKSNDAKRSGPFHSSKGRWKLNPLAYWSYDQVWSYIRNNDVPYNPLYDQGFTSVGDEMTTSKPTKSDEGERSGRFAGFGASNRECGLHVDLDLDPADMKLDDNDENEEPDDSENITCDIDKARQGECPTSSQSES